MSSHWLLPHLFSWLKTSLSASEKAREATTWQYLSDWQLLMMLTWKTLTVVAHSRSLMALVQLPHWSSTSLQPCHHLKQCLVCSYPLQTIGVTTQTKPPLKHWYNSGRSWKWKQRNHQVFSRNSFKLLLVYNLGVTELLHRYMIQMAGKQWQHHALVSSTWSQQLQHPYARGARLAVTTPKRDLHLQMWQHFWHTAPFTCVTLVRIMGTYYLNSQNLCLCRWRHISAYYCSGDIGKCTCVPWLWFLYPYLFSPLVCSCHRSVCCGYFEPFFWGKVFKPLKPFYWICAVILFCVLFWVLGGYFFGGGVRWGVWSSTVTNRRSNALGVIFFVCICALVCVFLSAFIISP